MFVINVNHFRVLPGKSGEQCLYTFEKIFGNTGGKISYLGKVSNYFHLYFPRSITLALGDLTLLTCSTALFSARSSITVMYMSVCFAFEYRLSGNVYIKVKDKVILNLFEQRG